MASETKTKILGLNQWAASDRPQRADFLKDNTQLETLVGGHIKNTALHTTSQEKETWANPHAVGDYMGNGAVNRTITGLPFAPRMLLVAADAYGPVQVLENRLNVFTGMAGELFHTTGISLSGNTFSVQQSLMPVNDKEYICLNQQGVHYFYIAYR